MTAQVKSPRAKSPRAKSPKAKSPKATLIRDLKDARRRTLQLIEGLSARQLSGPKNLPTINPLPWEIGHVAYFHEYWCLRERHGLAPILANADALFDSIHIAHDTRWDLPLPPLARIQNYMAEVLDTETALLSREPDDAAALYLYRYALFHEDMHTEAFTITRQTLGHPAPPLEPAPRPVAKAGPLAGDVHVPGGDYSLGAARGGGFCFDNEKWAHTVQLAPFAIARAPVTNDEYRRFVEAGGYLERRYWSAAGWHWRRQNGLECPAYWRRGANGAWQCRLFNAWRALPPHQPVSHVSWHEAKAWCRWAGRRLPSEAEWELAASGRQKRTYPWGDEAPDKTRVNMDAAALGCIDVAALPQSDSPYGCRQMLGNVWEWTETTFAPYPGFAPDMYSDYSQPLFHTTKVLRGGAWPTRSRMLRNTWRNYYGAGRNDVFAGFRTCAAAAPARRSV